jgi:serine phosphatase RsbU (regulator of sigma subunit)
LDGFGVLEQLAANEQWRSIPVIIISAADDMRSIVRGIELGAVDFLPKPFEPAILHARLRAGLEKKRIDDLEQLYLGSLEQELRIGRQIQAGFLPRRIPQPTGWGISSYFKAAHEVAGDFYDVFEVEPNRLCLLLGDVTDKGVGSAIYMALYRSLLKANIMAAHLSDTNQASLIQLSGEATKRAIHLVNQYICQFHESPMLATFFLGILNTESGELSYTNAGHDPPLLVNGYGELTKVKRTGPVVGAIEEASYQVRKLQLEPGSSLVLYSDGIPDARSGKGVMFGMDKLEMLVKHGAESADGLSGQVLLALREFVGETEAYDDISLLVLRRDD